ncbi:hypothetical protein [Kamptonema sp. PCC 6506]|nr:hypothetical protein [Kamptonema sp. PCC 6506]CBN55267.1 hypothetical protein OSCI_1610012 [Kamptonema sp. PCC 6506]
MRAYRRRSLCNLNELKVEKPPDKTIVGRFSRWFDVWGYRQAP